MIDVTTDVTSVSPLITQNLLLFENLRIRHSNTHLQNQDTWVRQTPESALKLVL